MRHIISGGTVFSPPLSVPPFFMEEIMANKYIYDTSSVCTHDTTYELNHALVQLIQKSTGKQTHEIMNTIIAETNAMFKELEIDPNSKTAGAKWKKGWIHNAKYQWVATWNPKRKNKLVTFPGTDVKFNLIINIKYHEQFQQWDPNKPNSYGGQGSWEIKAENCNEIKIKVTLP